MNLITKGNISRYYAETLVLLFFPGSKFPKEENKGDISVYMSVEEKDYGVVGSVTIKDGEREVSATYVPSAPCAAKVSHDMLIKLAAGGAMLRAGADFCGTVPPWGMITGVRPAKLCLDMLEGGKSDDEVLEHFISDFLCSEKKANLALMTAKKEHLFVTDERRRECSVYIAIPFCPTRCAYCSFVSFSSPKLLSLIPQYLVRLCKDIKNTFKIISEMGIRVATVYIGGGTPTTLSAKELDILLSCIDSCTDISALDEFTVEAGRPDTIDAEKMNVLVKWGVTRVSVNAQTLNDDVLKAIGRRHNSEDFLRAYNCALESGVRDINVDLIAGLPGEHFESFASSCKKIVDLDPTNITVHTFYVKRAADLRDDLNSFRAEDENTLRAVDLSQDLILSAGYTPYYLYKQKNTAANLENVGFSKNGHECLYNIFMMEEVHTVFGAGASAMTKLVSPFKDNMRIERICETKYPYEYLDPLKSDAESRYKQLLLRTQDFFEKYFK